MENLFALSGRVLVAGGTRGIGRAISLRFARAGAQVIAGYIRDQKAADELKTQAEEEGLRIRLCRGDITSRQGLEQVEKAIRGSGVGLTAMVYCAATGVHRPFPELTMRHFDFTFSLNVRAFFELTQLILPLFSQRASILAVSSPGAQRALPYYSLIGSTKGALEALARHLAVELAPRGIRVNILVPGLVATDVWRIIPDGESRVAAAIRRAPMQRLPTLDEIAYASQFLCSEAASGIIGHALVVDGGAGSVG